jgi:hypothetical protein
MCQRERLRVVSLEVMRGSQGMSKHQNVCCRTFRFVRNGSANFWRALWWYPRGGWRNVRVVLQRPPR